MNIIICYKYRPYATALYFESALKKLGHQVYSVHSSFGSVKGFSNTPDITHLSGELGIYPDLVILIDPSGDFFPRGWEKLDCPTAVYLVDVHRSFKLREMLAPFFDFIFIAQLDYVNNFRKLNYKQIHWLPLACDPEIHGRRNLELVWDIGFVGNINSTTRSRRLELLDQHFRMNEYGVFYPRERIAEIYSRSKIVFNSSIGGDLNMRVFEGLASGSLLITDRIGNGQSEIFKNRVHLVEYSSDEELLEFVSYYLKQDKEREAIAMAGHDLVLSKHTYIDRCQFMLDSIFSDKIPTATSRIRSYDQAKTRVAYARVYRDYLNLEGLLDELNSAWKTKNGYSRIFLYCIMAFSKTLYRIIRYSYF
jgi:hypothetical protein